MNAIDEVKPIAHGASYTGIGAGTMVMGALSLSSWRMLPMPTTQSKP